MTLKIERGIGIDTFKERVVKEKSTFSDLVWDSSPKNVEMIPIVKRHKSVPLPVSVP